MKFNKAASKSLLWDFQQYNPDKVKIHLLEQKGPSFLCNRHGSVRKLSLNKKSINTHKGEESNGLTPTTTTVTIT